LETNCNVGKWKKTDRNIGKRKKTDCNVGRKTLVFFHKQTLLFSYNNMSGRGRRSSAGCGGHGNNARSRRSHGRGQNYTGSGKASKNELCTTLGNNAFDYRHKAAADQMQTLWEKLVQYVGTSYGQNISNELQNKVTVIFAEPIHSPTVMARHATREPMICTGQANLQAACEAQRTILEAAVDAATDPEVPMKLAILNNTIAEGAFQQN
jgi:hypothetical protein